MVLNIGKRPLTPRVDQHDVVTPPEVMNSSDGHDPHHSPRDYPRVAARGDGLPQKRHAEPDTPKHRHRTKRGSGDHERPTRTHLTTRGVHSAGDAPCGPPALRSTTPSTQSVITTRSGSCQARARKDIRMRHIPRAGSLVTFQEMPLELPIFTDRPVSRHSPDSNTNARATRSPDLDTASQPRPSRAQEPAENMD